MHIKDQYIVHVATMPQRLGLIFNIFIPIHIIILFK